MIKYVQSIESMKRTPYPSISIISFEMFRDCKFLRVICDWSLSSEKLYAVGITADGKFVISHSGEIIRTVTVDVQSVGTITTEKY